MPGNSAGRAPLLRVYTLAFALQMRKKSTRDIIWMLWVPKAWGP
jgi:hypothetical protein